MEMNTSNSRQKSSQSAHLLAGSTSRTTKAPKLARRPPPKSKEELEATKQRRDNAINQFWSQVDQQGAKLQQYQREESFVVVVKSMHDQALSIQERLRTGGLGYVTFKMTFAAKFFLAYMASFTINRSKDTSFRYVHHCTQNCSSQLVSRRRGLS